MYIYIYIHILYIYIYIYRPSWSVMVRRPSSSVVVHRHPSSAFVVVWRSFICAFYHWACMQYSFAYVLFPQHMLWSTYLPTSFLPFFFSSLLPNLLPPGRKFTSPLTPPPGHLLANVRIDFWWNFGDLFDFRKFQMLIQKRAKMLPRIDPKIKGELTLKRIRKSWKYHKNARC